MDVHVSYKAGKTPDVEREFQHQLQKLERRLQIFKPELVHFHAIIEQQNNHSASTSLNLRLPSGQIAAQSSGENALAAVKSAFADLMCQVTKHKDLLRGHWTRSHCVGRPRATDRDTRIGRTCLAENASSNAGVFRQNRIHFPTEAQASGKTNGAHGCGRRGVAEREFARAGSIY